MSALRQPQGLGKGRFLRKGSRRRVDKNQEFSKKNLDQEIQKKPSNEFKSINFDLVAKKTITAEELTKASPSIEEIKYLVDTWLLNKSNFLAGKAELNLSKIVKDDLIKRTIEDRQKDIKKGLYREINAQIQKIVIQSQNSSRIVAIADLKYKQKIFKNSGELIKDNSFKPLKVRYILGFSNKSWKLVEYIEL